MTTTRLFHNGNSQAVHIPAEFTDERNDLDLEKWIRKCYQSIRGIRLNGLKAALRVGGGAISGTFSIRYIVGQQFDGHVECHFKA